MHRLSLAKKTLRLIPLAPLLLAFGASAQTWTEFGDAGDTLALAQTTRGPGDLTRIVGSTLGVDERDAYCIRVTDPATFSASTVNDGTDFDTRLFLFGRYDVALLANDDLTSTESKSLLTGTATDGSLFQLLQGGEYTLVISGFGEDATDATSTSLFDFQSDHTWVHSTDDAAGRMRDWQGDGATGSYQIDLTGAAACSHLPELIVAQVDTPIDQNQICYGIDDVGYDNCDEFLQPMLSPAVQAGNFNGDAFADVILSDLVGNTTQICLGDGSGRLGSCFEGPDARFTELRVADLNGDQFDDLVLVRFLGGLEICLGDGSGGFPFCTAPGVGPATRGLRVGYLDGDPFLDLVAVRFNSNALWCRGDGNGGLLPSDSGTCPVFEVYPDPGGTPEILDVDLVDLDNDGDAEALFVGEHHHYVCTGVASDALSCNRVLAANDVRTTHSVATADLDGDGDLDAVFGNDGVDRVCLGNGSTSFSTCADFGSDSDLTQEVLLEDVDGDGAIDAVLSKATGIATCPGIGNGTFQPCVTTTLSTSERLSRLVIVELGQPLFADGFESGDTIAWN